MTNPIRQQIKIFVCLAMCFACFNGCQLLGKRMTPQENHPLAASTSMADSARNSEFANEDFQSELDGPISIGFSDLPYIPEEFRANDSNAGAIPANTIPASAQAPRNEWSDYAAQSPTARNQAPVVTPAHLLGQTPQPRPQTREPVARSPVVPALTSGLAAAARHPAPRTNQPVASQKPSLTVRLSGLQPGHGPVRLAVFSGQKSFPDHSSAAKKAVVAVNSSVVQQSLSDLPPGLIAIAAYQDLNNDGQLNRGTFGIPKEPYGFSNNAKGSMGPPGFKAASVNPAKTSSLEIKLSQVRF